MARECFDFQAKEWVSPGELARRKAMREPPRQASKLSRPMIMRDIDPYRSVIDDTVITSRSQERDYLKRHGVVQVGNEKPKQKRAPTSAEKEAIERDIVDDIKHSAREHGVDIL